MRSQLERAINLAANTGDKIIVVDEFNDRSSVVMNLDEYEKLLNGENKGNREIENLTEEELLDKINRDIVTWKNVNGDRDLLDEMTDLDDDLDDEIDDDSSFAKFLEEDDDEEIETEPVFAEADEKDIFPDFTAPEAVSESIIEPVVEPVVEEESAPEVKKEEEKSGSGENLYYYNEPEKTENQSAFAKAPADEEESGFTSIKDELMKNRKTWEIPKEVKDAAVEVEL